MTAMKSKNSYKCMHVLAFSENRRTRVEVKASDEWNLMDRLKVTTLYPQEALRLVQPVLLGYLLRYFESYDPNDYHGFQLAFCYALGMSLCPLLMVVLHHIYFQYQTMGMKIRVALCHMIYKKVSLLDGAGGEWVWLETGCILLAVGQEFWEWPKANPEWLKH